MHHKSDAKIYIVIGDGKIILNGVSTDYRPGNNYNVPRGTSHGFRPDTRTLFLSVQNPQIKDPLTGELDVEYIE